MITPLTCGLVPPLIQAFPRVKLGVFDQLTSGLVAPPAAVEALFSVVMRLNAACCLSTCAEKETGGWRAP